MPATVGELRSGTSKRCHGVGAGRRPIVVSTTRDALRSAWLMASRIRNAVMLLRGRAADSLPTDSRELSAVALILGYAKGESSLLVEDYRHRARLARQVMDHLFWGLS